jgi:hypothetical protein
MFGPVFTLELLRERRRGRFFPLLPWAYAGLLAWQAAVFWIEATSAARSAGPLPPAPIVPLPSKVQQLVVQHFVVLFLLTPALTASALGEEKAKGTLADLFTTALTSVEIVAGKLLARSLRALQVALAGFPILCAVGSYSGLPPLFFVALFVVSVLVVLGLGAVGLLMAVTSRYTSGAILATYGMIGVGALAVNKVRVLRGLDPFDALAPAWGHADTPETFSRLLAAALAWGLVAAVCFAVAVWRLRPDGLKQMHGAATSRTVRARAAERPPVDDDPIRWKEYHIDGLAVLPLLRRVSRPVGVVITGALACVATTFSGIETASRRVDTPLPFIAQGLLFLLVATLVVTVRSAGAVTGERERNTWDSLRLTRLDGETFLRGKLRGILDAVMPHYIAYAVPAFFISMAGGLTCLVPTVGSLALAWPLMYHAAACGLRASANSRTTWAAVVLALVTTYLSGLLISFSVFVAAGIFFIAIAFSAYAAAGAEAGEVVAMLAMLAIPGLCALALTLLARSHLQLAEDHALGSQGNVPLSPKVHPPESHPDG